MTARARQILALVTLVMAIAACNNGGGGAASVAPAVWTAPAASAAPAVQSVSPAASGGTY